MPVRDDHGVVVAGIHICALSNRMDAREEARLVAAARAAATQSERDLGRVEVGDAGDKTVGAFG